MDGTLNFDCYSLGAQLGIDNHNNFTPNLFANICGCTTFKKISKVIARQFFHFQCPANFALF